METKTKASTGQQNFLLVPGQLVETGIATRILTLEHRELSKVTLNTRWSGVLQFQGRSTRA